MINSEIVKRIIGLSEAEAIVILKIFNCSYRILSRNWVIDFWASEDRDDDRYNLHLEAGNVVRVTAG